MTDKTKNLSHWKSSRNADYIRTDKEVDDLVGFLDTVSLVVGGGSVDLDEDEPVYVGIMVDRNSGDKPKGAIAISQHLYATRNSILNHADDLLRGWYIEHNHEFITSIAENQGEEYDAAWEGDVWHLAPGALDEALNRLSDETLGQISVERDQP